MSFRMPIGIEDYITAQRYYYVDKTMIINNLINDYIGKSLLVTRPRRFGKSLNLSMLECFFTNKSDSKEYFKDKMIFANKEICENYMNKYPVIRLNFKNIMASSYTDLCDQIIESIANIYKKYPEIASSEELFDFEREEYYKLVKKEYNEPFKYASSILNLSEYLFRIYKKKVIILIDEYDTPIQAAYDNNYYDEAIPFFKSFYSSTLKGNENMLFSFITGVLEIGKESLFSGLNNLNVSTIVDNELSEFFGFTNKEIDDIIKTFEINESIDTIRKWYGGYGTKEIEIFNPWSILNYVEKREFSYYWVNTSTNSLINSLIKNNNDQYIKNKEIFAEFLNNKKMKINFNPKISYRDINNTIDSLFSFLVQTGYLTAKKDDSEYTMFIPNKEIEYVFKNEIIGIDSSKSSLNIASALKDAFAQAAPEKIKEILEKYVLTSFSYYDLTDEKRYQILITGILAILFDQYVVKSEVNNQRGRCDIMISPKEDNNLGIVVEIKQYKAKTSKSRLEAYASSAINKIKEKQYYQELKERDIKHIVLYGIACSPTSLKIQYEEM